MKPKVTDDGRAALIRALDGEGLTFTKIVIGNGEAPADYTAIHGLMNPLHEIQIAEMSSVDDEYILLKGTFMNGSITSAFYWTEVGIFIQDLDNPQSELLYAYGHYQLSDNGEAAAYIPLPGAEIYQINLNYRVYIGDAENITANVSQESTYALAADFTSHVENTGNPHRVTKTQVGLGNVPNVTTDNQTPTVTTAESVTQFVQGDTLKTIISKIQAAIGRLISHIADTAVHVTASEKRTWNNNLYN